ncbi:hypothetical protein ACWXWB_01555 [Pantoea dispersa]|nr:hypothetical protein [Pantoea dispersa]
MVWLLSPRLSALLNFSRRLLCQLALAASLLFWVGVVVTIAIAY